MTDRKSTSRIPVTPETRDLVKKQKRAGEDYDSLLQKMVRQYEPPEPGEGEP